MKEEFEKKIYEYAVREVKLHSKFNSLLIDLRRNGKVSNTWSSSSPHPAESMSILEKMGFLSKKSEIIIPDESLKDFQDKRVAIVGPSPHLMGTGYGQTIDEYDLVCRVHDYYFKDNTEDYGTRCDIISNCFIFHHMKKLLEEKEMVNESKYIISAGLKMWNAGLAEELGEKLEPEYIHIPDFWLYKLFTRIGTIGNTGYNTINIMRKFPVKEIHVCGISFYMQKDPYKKSYTNPVHKHKNPDPHKVHDQEKQKQHFLKILKEDSRITLDPFLERWKDAHSLSTK